jgi:hypothetical protein
MNDVPSNRGVQRPFQQAQLEFADAKMRTLQCKDRISIFGARLGERNAKS